MSRIVPFLLVVIFVVACLDERNDAHVEKYYEDKAQQDFEFATDQIKKNNIEGLLKLFEIATTSISAEDSIIAHEELRGYLYSKTELWIKAMATIEFNEFKTGFEVTDFDIYRFTPDGELPVTEVAKKVVSKLHKMKGDTKEEQVLINYLIEYYKEYLKEDPVPNNN